MGAGCTKIPAGYTGIKVKQFGTGKGVQDVALVTGRVFYNPFAYDVIKFPNYIQNVVWTADKREGSNNDESIGVEAKGGLGMRLNVGMTYKITSSKVPALYVKYRKLPKQLSDTYLRTKVRNIYTDIIGTYTIEYFIDNKPAINEEVKSRLKRELESDGFEIDTLSFIGSPIYPNSVKESIESKIKATQIALQTEREKQTAIAEAQKKIETARGEAKSITIRANAQAAANKKIASSITKTLIEYERIKKWDGALPKVTGQATPFIDLRDGK